MVRLRLLDWLQERLGTREQLTRFLYRRLPEGTTWWHALGSAAFFLILVQTLTGFFPLEAYQDLGLDAAQIEEVKRYRRETAARNDYAPLRKYFKRDLHGSMVANLARLGLLTERVRPRLTKLGISLPTA